MPAGISNRFAEPWLSLINVSMADDLSHIYALTFQVFPLILASLLSR